MTIFTKPTDNGGALRITRSGKFLWFGEHDTGNLVKFSTGLGSQVNDDASSSTARCLRRLEFNVRTPWGYTFASVASLWVWIFNRNDILHAAYQIFVNLDSEP